MEKISVKDRLPEPNSYVLIHLTKDNWHDKDDPAGKRYWRVAKFIRGISEQDRERMRAGEIEDGEEIGMIFQTPPGIWKEIKSRRSSVYKSEDEHGNNAVPYCWDEFGLSKHFGQEVDYWCELPE